MYLSMCIASRTKLVDTAIVSSFYLSLYSAKIFNLNRCIPVIPKSTSGKLYEIETNQNCISIYSQENCGGKFIRFQSGNWSSHIRNMQAHRDLLRKNEVLMVASIGPCFDKCDPRNWAGMRSDVPVNVTLFNDRGYTGEECPSVQCFT